MLPSSMMNLTAEEDYTNNQTGTARFPTGVFTFISAFNIFLSFTAAFGNTLILVALHKETSLYPPTKLLLRCLATTDLFVGLSAQPLFSFFLVARVTNGVNARVINYVVTIYQASSCTLCGVSVLTLTAISFDRLLALQLGLRYRYIVTRERVRAILLCLWFMGISFGSIYLWSISFAFTVAFTFTTISILTSIYSYIKIYLKLRHRQLQVCQSQVKRGGVLLNVARFKQTVSNVLWVQLSLVGCYIPFIVVVTSAMYDQIGVSSYSFQVTFTVTATLTYLNSSLNPVLYCWKIGTVRKAMKNTIRELSCFTSVLD